MNREIKFRVWDGTDYMSSPFTLLQLQSGKIQFLPNCPVMQYTGLKDRNGKEIYEGDILKWVSSNPFSLGEERKVFVEYVQARFWCQGNIGVYLAELLTEEKCEVIGNIYENPELAEKVGEAK